MISEEEYDRITQALVIRLRQHEETVAKDSKQHHPSPYHSSSSPTLETDKLCDRFSCKHFPYHSFTSSGSELPGMRQKELIRWYIDQQNEKKKYSSQEQVKLDIKKLRAIIEVNPKQSYKLRSFQIMFLSNTTYGLYRVWYVKKVIL